MSFSALAPALWSAASGAPRVRLALPALYLLVPVRGLVLALLAGCLLGVLPGFVRFWVFPFLVGFLPSGVLASGFLCAPHLISGFGLASPPCSSGWVGPAGGGLVGFRWGARGCFMFWSLCLFFVFFVPFLSGVAFILFFVF